MNTINDEKNAFFLEAVSQANIEIVEILIKAKVDVNTKDNYGRTALMKAVENNQRDLAEILIKAGANINARDNFGWTTLMMAAENGYFEMLEILIKAGANVNEKDELGWTALMKAVENNQRDLAEILIKAGANINNIDNFGRTALIFAANNGYIEVVDMLIESGAKVKIRDNNKWTALIFAIKKFLKVAADYNLDEEDINLDYIWQEKYVYACIINSIIEGGIDYITKLNPSVKKIIEINNANAAINNDYNKKEALKIADKCGYLYLEKLIKEANIDEKINDDDSISLFQAIEKGSSDTVKMIIEAGANVNVRDHNGNTPLKLAVKYNNIDIVKILIEAGADVNTEDNEGNTDYFYAVNNGKGDPLMVKLLLKLGCYDDIDNIVLAARAGNVELVKMLLDEGFFNSLISVALIEAASNGYANIVKMIIKLNNYNHHYDDINVNNYIEYSDEFDNIVREGDIMLTLGNVEWIALNKAIYNNHLEVAKILIGIFSEIGAINNFEAEVLWLAAKADNLDIIRRTISRIGDIGDIDFDRIKYGSYLKELLMEDKLQILLFKAVEIGYDEGCDLVMEALIYSGIDINFKDDNGWTALLIAVENGHIEVVKMLIGAGADINIKGNGGLTALMRAAKNGYIEIVKMLIESGAYLNTKNLDGETAYDLAKNQSTKDLIRQCGGKIGNELK
jgi:serine/threonine-protein phosphatase 6 regulatory ankyrin repeat subunit B